MNWSWETMASPYGYHPAKKIAAATEVVAVILRITFKNTNPGGDVGI
jgi:hypothetical protein